MRLRCNLLKMCVHIASTIALCIVLSSCNRKDESHNDTNLKKPNRPNILLIQLDDLGYDDISLHGNEIIETPNIDELGQESVRFEQFYVSSLCAPTRASLLTGRNFWRTGVSGVHAGRDFINLNETLLPEILQANGYATGMWGKWHSGKTDGYFPWDRGFDEAYYASLYNYFDNEGLYNGEALQTKGSATSVITDFAIDFIERNKDKPFFAYVPYMAPHNPWRAPKKNVQVYLDKGLSVPMATLYGMIDNVDNNIGRLLSALKVNSLDKNTIVVFLSDNGPWVKSYRFGLSEQEWIQRNPSRMRGMKAKNWENGIRSPLYIRWPDKYLPSVNDALVQVEDLFPTILSWAKVPIPGHLQLDGKSLAEIPSEKTHHNRHIISAFASPYIANLNNESEHDAQGFYRVITEQYREKLVYSEQRLAVHKGDWKYLLNADGKASKELYNVSTDPYEVTNLATAEKQRVASFETTLRAWFKEILSEPHAFRMPIFQIGYKGNKESFVYAASANNHSSDLKNTAHYLGGWKNPGAWAEYNVNIVTEGTYELYLTNQFAKRKGVEFELELGELSATSDLLKNKERYPGTLVRNESAYWRNFDLKSTFDKDIKNQYVATWHLTPGPAKLRLKLKSNDVNHGMNKIISFNFVRLDN